MLTNNLRPAWLAVALLAALLAWDASGLDLALAHWFGGPQGFPLRSHWLLAHVLHDDARYAAWLFTLLLCAGTIWPLGPLARLPFHRRLQLPATALLATALVSALKTASATSCPWDLSDFGGVAHYVSHWNGWLVPDGGSGRCFPAGHASTGFAFAGGYFVLRTEWPRLAWMWLGAALAAGFVFGSAQQLRGAHFMSHTLWTAWLCGVVGWLADLLFGRLARAAEPEFAA